MQADLADAGIPYIDESGRYFDFHALRHEAGTLLAAANVHPKVAQSILRHSDINLTMGIPPGSPRCQREIPMKYKDFSCTYTSNFGLECAM